MRTAMLLSLAAALTLAAAPALQKKLTDQAKTLLEGVREKVEKKNIPFEAVLRTFAQPHEAIIREAKEKDIDLIVVGTHGRTGLKGLFMGSVAQKVISHAPCPVLVVPALK